MKNPYNQINPLSFVIERLGILAGKTVFVIRQADHTPFDMCVFRDHLVRFLADETEGAWTAENLENDLKITLVEDFDIKRLRDNFRVA